jgi:hypothetical protein
MQFRLGRIPAASNPAVPNLSVNQETSISGENLVRIAGLEPALRFYVEE